MRTIINAGITGLTLRGYLNTMFQDLYRGFIKYASDYGFSPAETATNNVAALQSAVLGGGTIYIKSGTYDMNWTVLLDSNTTIICEPGTILKKTAIYTQVFLNRGALTKTYNENIIIDGLEISVNGFEPQSTLVWGLNGQLGFYYIKNLTIRNFTCKDGGIYLFMLVTCRWENVSYSNCKITSGRDGFSFQTGHDAIVSDSILETVDDGMPLKCIDYPNHITEIGDVYNITFRNIVDRTALGTVETGFACRAMTASWTDWLTGMTWRTGDCCLNAGHLYQNHNGNSWSGVGTVAPVHTSGVVTGADGVTWRYKQDCNFYATHIHDIKWDGCSFEKNRTLISVELYDDPVYLRAAYPGTETLSTVYNIFFVNSKLKYTLLHTYSLLVSMGNLRNIVISGNSIDGAAILYACDNITINFPSTCFITFNGNNLKNIDYVVYDRHNQEDAYFVCASNTYENCTFLTAVAFGARLRMVGNDLPLAPGHLAAITFPVVGDIVRDVNGLWCWNGATWNELSA